MTSMNPWRNPLQTGRKALGKLRRRFVRLPGHPRIGLVNRRVCFEFERLPFLDEGDLRAMMTHSYDITLCDYLKQCLASGDIVLDVGANVGYYPPWRRHGSERRRSSSHRV